MEQSPARTRRVKALLALALPAALALSPAVADESDRRGGPIDHGPIDHGPRHHGEHGPNLHDEHRPERRGDLVPPHRSERLDEIEPRSRRDDDRPHPLRDDHRPQPRPEGHDRPHPPGPPRDGHEMRHDELGPPGRDRRPPMPGRPGGPGNGHVEYHGPVLGDNNVYIDLEIEVNIDKRGTPDDGDDLRDKIEDLREELKELKQARDDRGSRSTFGPPGGFRPPTGDGDRERGPRGERDDDRSEEARDRNDGRGGDDRGGNDREDDDEREGRGRRDPEESRDDDGRESDSHRPGHRFQTFLDALRRMN